MNRRRKHTLQRFILTSLGACITLLSLGIVVAAQEDPLDRPFTRPMYIIHITVTGTPNGPRVRDDYMLYPAEPQNGILITPDGMGGTFTNKAQTVGGPFYTLRQVCDYARGWGSRAQALGCPAPGATPTPSRPVPDETSQSATRQSPDKREKKDLFSRIAEWWDGLNNTKRAVVVLLVLGVLYAFFSSLGNPSLKANFRGKMSTFGGPNDSDPDTELALINEHNAGEFSEFFRSNPPDTNDLFHDLNPEKFYIACRWNYKETSKQVLVRSWVKVTNPVTGQMALAKPVDWGPAERTGRVADLSDGLANFLGLSTDNEVEVTLEQ